MKIDISTRVTNDEIARLWLREFATDLEYQYDEERGKYGRDMSCLRCGGKGYIDVYNHYADGVCFECGGAKTKGLVHWETPKARVKRIRPSVRRAYNKAREAAERQAARERDWQLALGEHPWIPRALEMPGSLAAKCRRIIEEKGGLPNAMIPYLERAWEEFQAPSGEVVEGRIEFEAKVLSWKNVEGYGTSYSYSVVTKLLLEVHTPRGAYKLWGTVPQALCDECHERGAWDEWLRGTRVRMRATCERSAKDPAFGFYKRAAKVEVLEVGGE